MKKIALILMTVVLTVMTVSCETNNQKPIVEENDTIEETIEDWEDGDTIVVIDLNSNQDTAK